MALNANCVANVTTTGSDDNAGWFDTSSGDAAGGANDRAFSNSPIIIDGATITASVHTTTTQATLVGHTLASTDRGNVLRISGGTATAGYYRITSVDTANNRVTVDASMGSSGATITGRIGGAFASPGQAGATAVSSTTIWIKSGTYTLSNTTANTPGGPVNFQSRSVQGSNTSRLFVRGYSSTFWTTSTGPSEIDLSNRPLFSAGVQTSVTLFTSAAWTTFECLSLDGENGTANRGILFNAGDITAAWCVARRFKNQAFRMDGSYCSIHFCQATECTTNSAIRMTSQCFAVGCCANANVGVIGFEMAGDASHLFFCISSGNATGVACNRGYASSCVFSLNTGVGADVAGNSSAVFVDCVATSNGTRGWTSGGFGGSARLVRCAGWNNPTENANRFETVLFTTLAADPFVNAAGGDFSLNDVAGGGATLKALNFALPGISTTRYPFGGWAAPKSGGCPLVGHGGLVY